jgi:hypothetical protein
MIYNVLEQNINLVNLVNPVEIIFTFEIKC